MGRLLRLCRDETGETIKGRRGAVSPCMIMRRNLQQRKNDVVKEEKDYMVMEEKR